MSLLEWVAQRQNHHSNAISEVLGGNNDMLWPTRFILAMFFPWYIWSSLLEEHIPDSFNLFLSLGPFQKCSFPASESPSCTVAVHFLPWCRALHFHLVIFRIFLLSHFFRLFKSPWVSTRYLQQAHWGRRASSYKSCWMLLILLLDPMSHR